MIKNEACLFAIMGGCRPDWRMVSRDFLKISDPRLMRNEIAHAHICENATCGGRTRHPVPRGPDNYPTYKMVRGLDSPRAGAMSKFPGSIHAQENVLRLNRVRKKRPEFNRFKSERRHGVLFGPGECFNFATRFGIMGVSFCLSRL